MRHYIDVIRIILLIGLFLLIPFGLFGQESAVTPGQSQPAPGALRGAVTAAGGAPLVSAAITVLSAKDSSLVTGAVSGANGRFQITGVPAGAYIIRIGFVGYTTVVLPAALTAASPVADLGTVTLATAPVELAQVDASTDKSPVTVQMDRSVYTTKNMANAQGSTATEILRNVPELDVDIDGNVKMQGSQSVAIHINGRAAPIRGEALKNYLQQLPSDRVERVEVIPNPSAKYDPEGMAGIINIVMKDDLGLGLSGNLSANGDSRGRFGTFSSLAYQTGPLTLFGSGNLALNGSRNTGFDLRENRLANPITFLQVDNTVDQSGRFNFFDASAELRLGKVSTLYGAARGNRARSGMEGDAVNRVLDANRVATDRYDFENENEFRFGTGDYSLGFRRIEQPQVKEMSADVHYITNANGNEQDYVKRYLMMGGIEIAPAPEYGSNSAHTDGRELNFQSDITRALAPATRLEAGYKGARRWTDYDQTLRTSLVDGDEGEDLTRLTSRYEYDETYHQLYATISRQFGRLGIQAGGRGEIAKTAFDLPAAASYDREYTNFFPSLNISYALPGGVQSRASYAKRLERPSPAQLNPYVPSTDPMNSFVGNPDLEPKYTHSFTLDLSKPTSMGLLRIAPFYRHTVNNWDYFKEVDSAGSATLTWRNTNSVATYGATGTVSLSLPNNGNGFVTVNAYRFVRDAGNVSNAYSGDGYRWDLSVNGMTRIIRGIDAQGFVRYQAPQDMPQGRISSSVMSNLGLRAALMDNKAWLNLSVQDPLDTFRFRFETRDASHVQTSSNRISIRTVRLGMTYNFGRPPQSTRKPAEAPAQAPSDQQPVIR